MSRCLFCQLVEFHSRHLCLDVLVGTVVNYGVQGLVAGLSAAVVLRWLGVACR